MIHRIGYDSSTIACYFLNRAYAEGKSVTPMQLQKLVYFAHGWYLALYAEPLIREDIEAWSYGPVIPALYREFKRFGDDPIVVETSPPALDNLTREFLDRIWDIYSKYSAIQLSNMTHDADSPWRASLEETNSARHTIIDNDTIRAYFSRQANKNAERE